MKPQITPLARWQRKAIFFTLLFAFLISLPAFIFYATGYRYDFFADQPVITATGGIYISAEAEDTLIYLNEEKVTNVRVFRQASYIQGLVPKMHRVHVQAPGLHTWVKDLAVQPHIVTEAEAFNMPLVSQIRPITEFSNTLGESIIFATSTSPSIFARATTTDIYVLSTSSATSSFLVNAEYIQLKMAFAEKITADKLREEYEFNQQNPGFTFATTTGTTSNNIDEIATTTKNRDDLSLYEMNGEVYVVSLVAEKDRPYFFCKTETLPKFLQSEIIEPETLLLEEGLIQDKTIILPEECRTTIKMDRQNQTVIDFDFFPENSNFVLLHLEDGIYLVEIDDRAWQNAQRLYEGKDLKMLLMSGNIFIKENDFMFEVLTKIPSN